MSIETLKGLYLLESLTAPVPATITQYLKNNLATGTGPYGTFTVMDFLGTAAGQNVTNLMLQAPTLIETMDVSVLQGLYDDMLATVSGTYGPNSGPVTIPSGPATGVYATGDLAFTTGLLPAAQAEIDNLIATYPNETDNLNSAFNTIAEQIFREAVNQAKAGVNFDTLPSDSQSGALSFASSLAQYGQDNTPGNSAEFLNTVAQFNTLPGQAIIGALREGRNYESLNQAGIPSANFNVPTTYPGDSAATVTPTLTPLPPVQPPIIPAPPAQQIPTNATSTDYTVEEAIAAIATQSEVSNSALSFAPPPVEPGPVPEPPPSYYFPRIVFNNPPNPPEGPDVRLFRSSSRVVAGEVCVIDAEVFSSAINSYPIGTDVPYSVTGIYVSGEPGPVDPSLITVSSSEGFAGRTVGYGLTPIPSGLPLTGTFRIVATRQGGFLVNSSTALPEDALLTITVAGTTVYLGVMAREPSLVDGKVDILKVTRQILFNGVQRNSDIEVQTVEVNKDFYVTIRPQPCSQFAKGTIVISSGPGFSVKSSIQPIQYTDNSSGVQGSSFRVPGSLIPTPGPVMITASCEIVGAGTFSGSKVIEVTPPAFPKSISVVRDGWLLSNAELVTDTVTTGKSFTIIVTGEPNTTFNWTGFGNSGTTTTDSSGRCVFPSLIAPPLSQFALNQFAFALGSGRDDYLLTVAWPDGEVIKSTVYVTAS